MNKNIPGTVVVKEKRTIKTILSDRYKEQLRRLDEMTPEEYDRQLKERKHAIQIAGGVATFALAACPVDGPVGEILTGVATPVLAEMYEGVCKMLKPIVFGLQKKLRGALVNSNNATTYEFDQKEYYDTSKAFAQNVVDFKGRAR